MGRESFANRRGHHRGHHRKYNRKKGTPKAILVIPLFLPGFCISHGDQSRVHYGENQDAVPSVTLVHVATRSPTVKVSSNVARKDPSTLALAAYIDER